MEKSGQSYGPPVAMPPDPVEPRLQDIDELSEIRVDRIVSTKVRLLWDHRRVLGRFVVAGIVVGLIVFFLMPRRYESSVRLMPPDMAGGSVGLMGAFAKSGSDSNLGLAATLLGAKSGSGLYLGVLGSRSVADEVIRRFDLQKEYGTKSYERARKILASNVDVSTARETGIITLNVTASSPQKARDMANAIVDISNQVMNNVSTSSARRERMFLEQRLAAIKTELDESARQFSTFASKNVALDIPAQAKATLEAAAKVQGELVAAQAELSGLEQIYTSNSTRVREVQARIATLKRELQGTDTATPTAAGGMDSLGQTIRNLPKLGITYADLYRTTMINEAVYEALTKQYEFAKVEEAKELPRVTALDPANLPERKSSPHGTIVLPVTTLLFFLIGAVGILAKDFWNNLDPRNEAKLYLQDTWSRYGRRLGGDRLRMRPLLSRPADNGNGSDGGRS